MDITSETPLSLTEATKALPRLDGKRPVPSTVWRWCRKGLRGVRLEHARVGHRVVTSREALNRFANRLAERDNAEHDVFTAERPQRPNTPRRDNVEHEKAKARLRETGILT